MILLIVMKACKGPVTLYGWVDTKILLYPYTTDSLNHAH